MGEYQVIPIDGGVVSAKDSSTLAKGDLMLGQNVQYLPNDMAPWTLDMRGWIQQGGNLGSAAQSVRITRAMSFDDGTRWVLMYSNDGRYKARAIAGGATQLGSSIVAADIQTALAQFGYDDATKVEEFDLVRYANTYYSMDSVNRGIAIGRPAAGVTTNSILHGMLANTSAPTASTAGAGNITLSANKSIKYWAEERWKAGSTVIKRSAAVAANVVTVTGAFQTQAIVITRPSVVNSDATHWALYGTATEGEFPTGRELGEVAIATTTITDPRTGKDPNSYDDGTAYEVAQISLAGATVNVAKYGPPPIASTGDVYEDCLVTNDVENPLHIRWSFYDTPHAFPSVNLATMEQKVYDKVVFIRRLGQLLIIGMQNSMWRINSLPQVDDVTSQPGRIKEQIEANHGAVSPRAVCLFSFGKGPRLAYVSRYGIHITDGYAAEDIMDDIDWETTVDVNELDRSILLNNPEKYRLEFYYVPYGTGATSVNRLARSKCKYIHYHPSHAKASKGGGFRAKVAGPNDVNIDSASGNLKGHAFETANLDFFTLEDMGRTFIIGFYTTLLGQTLVRMDVGQDGAKYLATSVPAYAADNDGYGATATVRTGDLYFEGIGGEFSLKRFGVHHSATTCAEKLTVKAIQLKSGHNDSEVSRTIELTRREVTTVAPGVRGEAVQLGAEYRFVDDGTYIPIRLNYFVAEIGGQGTAK